jgi:hypothetical protein
MNTFFEWLLNQTDTPRDRRRSPRYPAIPNSAFLKWMEGGRPHVSPARLLNISSAGACVHTKELPAEGRAAWLRLEEPAPTAWVKAKITRRARGRKAGLEFAEHCPYDFFKAVIQEVQHIAAVPPEFADGYWR